VHDVAVNKEFKRHIRQRYYELNRPRVLIDDDDDDAPLMQLMRPQPAASKP
jgi:hypothetical protein